MCSTGSRRYFELPGESGERRAVDGLAVSSSAEMTAGDDETLPRLAMTSTTVSDDVGPMRDTPPP
jgi:hypothetical protein